MEKLCGNSMIYNPYKRKAWAYLSLLFSFTIAMAYGLLTSQYSLTEVLILILLAIIDAISSFILLNTHFAVVIDVVYERVSEPLLFFAKKMTTA